MSSQDILLFSHNWKPRFFSIWVGQTISLLGTSLAQFAIIWHLTQQTGSATVLAMASLVGMLPQIVLGPVIGALVDRWNRRMVLIAADALNILTTLALALLFAAGTAQVWHIYLALMLRSASSSFRDSAMGASIVMLAPKEQFARLQGINQARMGLMSVLSAPLGALLLALTPIQNILHADWLTTLFAIAPLLVFSIPQPEKHPTASATSVFQDMKDGLTFVLGWRGLSIVILVAMLINLLLTPTFALTPLLVTKYFNGGVGRAGDGDGRGRDFGRAGAGRVGRVQEAHRHSHAWVDGHGCGRVAGGDGARRAVRGCPGWDVLHRCGESHHQRLHWGHYAKHDPRQHAGPRILAARHRRHDRFSAGDDCGRAAVRFSRRAGVVCHRWHHLHRPGPALQPHPLGDEH